LLVALGLLFSLLDGAQNVTRLSYTGEVDLWSVAIAIIVAVGGGRTVTSAALQYRAHALGFIAFERAGVGLLLFDADFIQHVENGPALYLKLSR